MKMLSLLCLLSAVTLGGTEFAFGKDPHPMEEVKKAMLGHYSNGALPAGFKGVKLFRRPKFQAPLLKYLAEQEEQSKRDFAEYVKTSGDFDHLTKEERAEALKHPTHHLGVRYLVEIQEVHKISKDGLLVGYVYSAADHVKAAIINDGSGLEIYVDPELNVIATDRWDS